MSKRTPVIAAVISAAIVCLALAMLMGVKDRPAAAPQSASTEKPESAPGEPPAVDTRHETIALETELKKKPDHVPILFRLALLARDSGKPAEAIPYLRKILDHEPNNLEAHLELGRAFFDTGNVQGALDETKRILDANPNHVDALYNLGAIYANLNQPETARSLWNRAVASGPDSESGKLASDALKRLGAAK